MVKDLPIGKGDYTLRGIGGERAQKQARKARQEGTKKDKKQKPVKKQKGKKNLDAKEED